MIIMILAMFKVKREPRRVQPLSKTRQAVDQWIFILRVIAKIQDQLLEQMRSSLMKFSDY